MTSLPSLVTSFAAVEAPAASIERQIAALELCQHFYRTWLDKSPSAGSARSFVEGERHVAPAAWRDLAQCGVLSIAERGRDHARVLTSALAAAAETPRGALRALESAVQAGVLTRRVDDIATAFEQQHGAGAWNAMAPRTRSRAYWSFLVAETNRRGAVPTEFFCDYPTAPCEVRGRVQHRYGAWLTIPVFVAHPRTGRPVIGGFSYRSLRRDVTKDGRHRKSRRNAFCNVAGAMLGWEEQASEIQARGAVTVVEGVMDYLAMRGVRAAAPVVVPPVVAVQGVSLTSEQRVQLQQRVRRAVLFLDGDKGGELGVHQLGADLSDAGIRVYVATVPPDAGKDPCDFNAKRGPAAVADAIRGAAVRPLPLHELEVARTELDRLAAAVKRNTPPRGLDAPAPHDHLTLTTHPPLRVGHAVLARVGDAVARWPGNHDDFAARSAILLGLPREVVDQEIGRRLPLSCSQPDVEAQDTEPTARVARGR